MITEDYVSFEIAKLLKEKGFDENCAALYSLESAKLDKRGVGYVFNNSQWDFYITAPTLQMTMKWFREVHHIGIFPTTYYRLTAEHEGHDYGCTLINLNTFEVIGTFVDCTFPANTYEETCEAAIKFCLEHLI